MYVNCYYATPIKTKQKCRFFNCKVPIWGENQIKFGFSDGRAMLWPACSPDLNPIENFWSQLTSKVYEGGRQFSSKKDLWEQIQTSAAGINKDSIKQLTNSMDSRLLKVVIAKGVIFIIKILNPSITG